MADADKIAAKFKLADRDGTGLLDRKAVARLFKSIGQTVGKKELDRMVRRNNQTRWKKKHSFLLLPLLLKDASCRLERRRHD
jgi:Ca2+-binding EF-hand superfamily protein